MEQKDIVPIFDLGKVMERNAHNLELKTDKVFEVIIQQVVDLLDDNKEPLQFSKVVYKPEPQEDEQIIDDTIETAIEQKANPTLVMIEGEIGSGKSTTSTTIMEIQSKLCGNKEHLKTENRFATGRQNGRVTSSVKTVPIGDLSVMDTPGTNDIENELSDLEIGIMKHQNMNENFSDSTRGLSCIIETIMLDGGCRLNQSKITPLIKMLNSLTYSYPGYDPITNPGPRIVIIFTNQSRNYSEDDDIGVEGIPIDLAQDPITLLKMNARKLKKIIVDQIWQDQDKEQLRVQIESKIETILPFENFYCYKIFPGDKEKLIQEKMELERVITDSKLHGNYYISNFDFEKGKISLPISFDHLETKHLSQRLINIFEKLVANVIRQLTQKYNEIFQFTNQKSKILQEKEHKFRQIFEKFSNLLKTHMYLLRRVPRQFEQVVQKIEDHFPLYLEKILDQEIHQTFRFMLDDKESKHQNSMQQMRKDHHNEQKKSQQRLRDNTTQYQNSATYQEQSHSASYEAARQSYQKDKASDLKNYSMKISKLTDENTDERKILEIDFNNRVAKIEIQAKSDFEILKQKSEKFQDKQNQNFEAERQNHQEFQRNLKKDFEISQEIFQFKIQKKEEACTDEIKDVKAQLKRLEDYARKLKKQIEEY